MSDTLKFWVVLRDGRGKWVHHYDPKYEIKDAQRFAFEALAIEYCKKMKDRDREGAAALAARQGMLPGVGGK